MGPCCHLHSCEVFSAEEKDITHLAKFVDSATLAGGCGVVLQTWMSRAALRCAVGSLLPVNSCFLSRWSGNCCTAWEGPGNSPFRQMNTTSGFLFISLCSHSLSTSLPSPFLLKGIYPVARNLTGIKGCLPCLAALSTPTACAAGGFHAALALPGAGQTQLCAQGCWELQEKPEQCCRVWPPATALHELQPLK